MASEVYEIINELNLKNGTNYKSQVLLKHKNNKTFERVLKMTYDTVQFIYGVGKTTLNKIDYPCVKESKVTLDKALDILQNEFCTRHVSGNAAIARLEELFGMLDGEDRFIISKVLERDLRINLGKTQINKVFKGLITKPAYMRCDVYSQKTAKNIKFPAFCQVKMDGTYREFVVDNGQVSSRSRSGEEYEYPIIFEQLSKLNDGVYIGELTVRGIRDRAAGNGLINSDNPPHDDIILSLWDFVKLDEYDLALQRDRKKPCKLTYRERWSMLKSDLLNIDCDNIELVPNIEVNSLQEALKATGTYMTDGLEGSILKDLDGVFKDGTSKQQLKLKLEISAEMRCVGFHEGTKGTKREGKVGSIIFENDEGTVKGKCSGFTDKELDYFTENQDKLIGKVLEVQFNDLTKARENEFFALSHPRFIEWRNDKDETDTLEKIYQLREMAMELG